MQGMYALGWGGYWLSSAFAFALTSVLSFFLNKRFSFRNRDSVKHTAWRFALVIGVCYLLAYSAAQPATAWLLDRLLSPHALKVSNDQIALFVGQVLFTGLTTWASAFSPSPGTREPAAVSRPRIASGNPAPSSPRRRRTGEAQ